MAGGDVAGLSATPQRRSVDAIAAPISGDPSGSSHGDAQLAIFFGKDDLSKHDTDVRDKYVRCSLFRRDDQTALHRGVLREVEKHVAGTRLAFEDWAASEGEITAEEARADLAQLPGVDGTAMLVVGSSGDAKPGRVRLSSKTDRLVHSSPIPVAIAPRGYRTDSNVTRVTVAFRDDDPSWSFLTGVAETCRRTGARRRLRRDPRRRTRRDGHRRPPPRCLLVRRPRRPRRARPLRQRLRLPFPLLETRLRGPRHRTEIHSPTPSSNQRHG